VTPLLKAWFFFGETEKQKHHSKEKFFLFRMMCLFLIFINKEKKTDRTRNFAPRGQYSSVHIKIFLEKPLCHPLA
jgi:hypothetical protein